MIAAMPAMSRAAAISPTCALSLSASSGVECALGGVCEFYGELVLAQRRLWAGTIHQRLLDHPFAIPLGNGEDRGRLIREYGIATGITANADLRRQRTPHRISDQLLGEIVNSEPEAGSADQCRGNRIRPAELGLVSSVWRLFPVQRFADCVQHRRGDRKMRGLDILRSQSLAP